MPSVSINDVTTTNEAAGNVTFTLTLSAASRSEVIVGFAVSSGSATSGTDFTATSGILTFAAGQTVLTTTLPISVIADDIDESDETAIVTLSSVQNATISDATGILTITDDDIETTGDDFSGRNFTDGGSLVLPNFGNRETIKVDARTEFGTKKLVNIEVGSADTTDVYDYASSLKAGDGTDINSSTNLTILNVTDINLSTLGIEAKDVIVKTNFPVLDFEASRLPIDLTGSSPTLLADIIKSVQNLLEDTNSGTNLTRTNDQVVKGNADTDVLLVFYEAIGQGTTEDAVIIHYEEANGLSSFENELSVHAIFEDIRNADTFDNANIV